MNHAAVRFVLAAVLLGTLADGVASADVPDPAGAETLFRRGRASADAGDYPRACGEFTESLRLEPVPGTMFNLADCEEHLGRLASAWGHFLRVESLLPVTDERRGISHERAAALAVRVPRLVITLAPGAPAGARVFRDDIEIDSPGLGVPMPVDPGLHGVLVVAAGRESSSTVAVAVEGATLGVVASPGPVMPLPMVPKTLALPAARTNTAAWLVGATGIVALGVGAYFGGRALAERGLSDASCAGGVCGSTTGLHAYESARSDALAADVALGVGIAALAVGGYLLLTTGTSPRTGTGIRLTGPGLRAAW